MRNRGISLAFALFFVVAPCAGDLFIMETRTATGRKFVNVRIFHREIADLVK